MCYYNSVGKWSHSRDCGFNDTDADYTNDKLRDTVRFVRMVEYQRKINQNISKFSQAIETSTNNTSHKSQSTPSIHRLQDPFNVITQPFTFYMGFSPNVPTTPLGASAVTAMGYALTTPLNIAFYWSNPDLSINQKQFLTYYEIGVAAGGIMLTYAMINIYNLSGQAVFLCSAAYWVVTALPPAIITSYSDWKGRYL